MPNFKLEKFKIIGKEKCIELESDESLELDKNETPKQIDT